MSGRFSNVKRVALVAALGSFALVGASSVASAGLVPVAPLNVSQILVGSSFTHTFTPSNSSSPITESLSNIDDLTQLGDELFVVFQNGVGPNGEASTSGNLDRASWNSPRRVRCSVSGTSRGVPTESWPTLNFAVSSRRSMKTATRHCS